jgi:MoaA/NifB/PqqE/SkfB family radical SAM enzyme
VIKTTAIKLVHPEPMMVTWDLGRRCNYDCTYCEATRHDLVSPHHTLDEFIKTFEFIKSWTSLYNNARRIPSHTNINFTGGEPTVNPSFWKLVKYINEDKNFHLSLTTNGAWASKHTKDIVENFKGITVSYHAEADPTLRNRVIENILKLYNSGVWLQVNVMLHTDHWNHCVSVYEKLKSYGIKTNPRPIGDGIVERTSWFIDSDGSMRRTSHAYTSEQQQWFFDQMGFKETPQEIKQGTQLGRACCGGRCTVGKVSGEWKDVKLVNTNFKDWSCTVDWYFLHIDQHTGTVYHHQTCQALHNGKQGPVGYLKEADKMLADLSNRLSNPQPIICPNQKCGCGMCVPKAESNEDFNDMWKSIVRI